MKHSDPRPELVGSDEGPQAPYPLKLEGPVVKGFGRGSKELGIPTANLPISGLDIAGHTDLDSGVYFGFASLPSPSSPSSPSSSSPSAPGDASTTTATTLTRVYPMVMSIGWNPFYKNSVRSVEVHVMHDFAGADFYGAHMRLLMLGFVRPELDYVSKEALIDDINTDIKVSLRSLDRERWSAWREDEWLRAPAPAPAKGGGSGEGEGVEVS